MLSRWGAQQQHVLSQSCGRSQRLPLSRQLRQQHHNAARAKRSLPRSPHAYAHSQPAVNPSAAAAPPPPHRASVASLRHAPVLLSGSGSTRHVPLLPPSVLPFTSCLEIVSPTRAAGMEGPANYDVLELVYVLAGEGSLICRASGSGDAPPSTWQLQAGASALAWAGSTCLAASSDDQLVVIKFHIPAAVLDPLSPVFGSVDAALELLHALDMPWPAHAAQDGSARGTLEEAELSELLCNAHQRARRAFNTRTTAEQQQQRGGSPSRTTITTPTTRTGASTGMSTGPPLGRSHVALPVVSPGNNPRSSSSSSSPSGSPSPSSSSSGSSSSPSGSPSPSSSIMGDPAPSKGYSSDASTGLRAQCNGDDSVMLHTQNSLAASASSGKSTTTSPSSSIQGVGDLGEPSTNGGGEAGRSPQDTPALKHQRVGGHFSANESVLIERAMEQYQAYQFPNQKNRLALAFDPDVLGLSLSFGIEVFTPKHCTPIHTHSMGYEMFFVLAGEGDAWCDGHHIPVRPGDCIVFPPGTKHGLDNPSPTGKMYTLQMMVPDDSFVAFVQSGESVGSLDDDDMCVLTAARC